MVAPLLWVKLAVMPQRTPTRMMRQDCDPLKRISMAVRAKIALIQWWVASSPPNRTKPRVSAAGKAAMGPRRTLFAAAHEEEDARGGEEDHEDVGDPEAEAEEAEEKRVEEVGCRG